MEAPQYVKQMSTDIKGEIDNKRVIVEDIKMTHVSMDRWFGQKIDKETQTLNEILGQIDLIDIYRTFCPKAGKCTFFFFSSTHETFSRRYPIFGHKADLVRFKKTEIISSIFSDYTMRLEIN